MEFDILRDKAHDLTCEDLWNRIFTLVQEPHVKFLTTPPCHTFSRARHRKPGPPPLRSNVWPRGFPWLKDTHASEVKQSNFLITKSIEASRIASSSGNEYLWEHPEDLGVAADGSRPGSIWQWPEIMDLLSQTSAITFAFHQCAFNAPYPKPTRFLTTLSHFKANPPPFSKLPTFSNSGHYLGPLPRECPHNNQHDHLIGMDATTGKWRTGHIPSRYV